MTAAEQLTTSETVYDYPLADIRDPSIPNYRTTFEGMDDLTASIKESGVLVPLVLRPVPAGLLAGHELVIGARRREAAKRAGLTTVPVVIRDYDDDQVLEARAIENLQRVNPDPLDEAAAFKLLVSRGFTEQQLADKLGQPLLYVLARLALNTLCKEAKQALGEGKILLGVAILIAGLPSVKVQQEALQEVVSTYRDELMTVPGARDAISRRVLLQLSEAKFKLDDATLVPKAGPCTVCPKRTGHQGNLFGSTSKDDLCLDPVCHRSKVDALYQLRVTQAKADGSEVLSKKASEEALKSCSVSYGTSTLVRLDDEARGGPSGRNKKLKVLFGKELPPVTIAWDEDSGLPVELVPRAAALKAIKAFNPSAVNATNSPSKADAKAKAEREAELVQGETRRRTMVALVEACDAECRKGAIPRPLLRLFIRGALVSTWSEIAKRVADRRGLPLTDEVTGTPKKGARRQLAKLQPAERIERLLPQLDEGGLASLLLELVMGRAAPGKWSEGSDCYTDLCTELGVNPKGLEANVKAERKAKADGKGKAAKKPEPQPLAKKKAAKKTPPRPEHPATGQTVHYIDPSGLSQTGVACGGKVGGGKGIVTDDAAKVTCKSCKRTAGLE